MVDCIECGASNYPGEKSCRSCSAPLPEGDSHDHGTSAEAMWSSSEEADLGRIADAMERNATATERIFLLMLTLALLGLVIGLASLVLF